MMQGVAMAFVQMIEFESDLATFHRLRDRYLELMGDQMTSRRSTLLADRDRPGVLIQLVEFDSFEEAMANSEHPGTQQWAAEASEVLGEASFRNCDVVEVQTL